MKLRVKYYALLRDIVGTSEDELEISSCRVEARDLLGAILKNRPELSSLVSSGRALVLHGGKLVSPEEEVDVCSDSTIDIVPPSAGGCGGSRCSSKLILGEPVNPHVFIEELLGRADPEAGAVAVYFGVVKGKVAGRAVEELRYEYHEEHTKRALEKIACEASTREGVKYVQVYHSVGSFKPGAVVLAVGVLGVGRKDSIETLREVVERVKHETLVWKIERREDGEFWVVGDGERVPRVRQLKVSKHDVENS